MIFLFTSCRYDMDDRGDRLDTNNPNQDTINNQFVTQDGIVYFTGLIECSGTGEYGFDENKVLDSLTIPVDLPENFDLSVFLPPIGNQGKQGSCTSWATTYYLKSLQERIESGVPYDSSKIMSPAYTYNQITQGICEGTTFESTINILKEKGTTSIESFPYFDHTCTIQPSQAQDIEAETNRVSDYKYLSGENMVLEMKTLINDQMPILIATLLTSEFGKKDNLGLTSYREHFIDYSLPSGCHAMLVVGYSDPYNAFKVVNSWGEDWGDVGYVWIDYAAFNNVLDETAEFRVINSAIIVYDL